MSASILHPASRSRWMDWKPKARILADIAESEPTKTSKTGSVVFEGATPGESPKIGAGTDPAEPWKVRDRTLDEMGWCSKGTPWAEWKAAALNRLIQEHSATGEPGRITAATVRHGERKAGGNG